MLYWTLDSWQVIVVNSHVVENISGSLLPLVMIYIYCNNITLFIFLMYWHLTHQWGSTLLWPYLCIYPLLHVHGGRSHVIHFVLNVCHRFICASDYSNNSNLGNTQKNPIASLRIKKCWKCLVQHVMWETLHMSYYFNKSAKNEKWNSLVQFPLRLLWRHPLPGMQTWAVTLCRGLSAVPVSSTKIKIIIILWMWQVIKGTHDACTFEMEMLGLCFN